MKIKKLLTVFLLFLVLVSCAPAITAIPTETVIPTSTFTPVPTATITLTPVPPTPTITPIPPLESLPVTQDSVSQFTNAMQKAGITITAEQILNQRFQLQTITGANGKQYEIAIIHLDPDTTKTGETLEGKLILCYLEKNKEGEIWRKFTMKSFTEMTGIPTGALTSNSRITNVPAYKQTLLDNYSMVLIDGDMYPDKKNGTLTQLDFSKFDNTIKFIQAMGVPVEFQHVIRDERRWFPESANNQTLKTQDAEQALRVNVRKVMERYKDAVTIWSVVNEAINGDGHGGFTHNPYYDAMGIDYIRVAFDEAHKISPDATLLYNDFDLESDSRKRAEVHKFLQPLIDSGLVDGVGIQMHYDGSRPPNKSVVLKAIKEIGSWGVSVHITELDVDMTNFKGTPDEKLRAQAKIYNEMIAALLESGYAGSISTFGFTDLTSLYGTDKEPAALASSPLPFDSDFHAKAAQIAILEAASEFLLK